jgi:hypothetical protein
MTKVLDQTLHAVRCLSTDEQDEIAREVRSLALEAQGFKPVPGGYAFRVSSPWLLGRTDYYLVTDVQIKAIAEARNTKSDMLLALLVSAFAAAVLSWVAVTIAPAISLVEGGVAVGSVLLWLRICGATVLANAQCIRWLTFRRLRPMLIRLARTSG